MSDSPQYFADADIWCENGHDPKIPEKDGDEHECQYCGAQYTVEVRVEVVE